MPFQRQRISVCSQETAIVEIIRFRFSQFSIRVVLFPRHVTTCAPPPSKGRTKHLQPHWMVPIHRNFDWNDEVLYPEPSNFLQVKVDSSRTIPSCNIKRERETLHVSPLSCGKAKRFQYYHDDWVVDFGDDHLTVGLGVCGWNDVGLRLCDLVVGLRLCGLLVGLRVAGVLVGSGVLGNAGA